MDRTPIRRNDIGPANHDDDWDSLLSDGEFRDLVEDNILRRRAIVDPLPLRQSLAGDSLGQI